MLFPHGSEFEPGLPTLNSTLITVALPAAHPTTCYENLNKNLNHKNILENTLMLLKYRTWITVENNNNNNLFVPFFHGFVKKKLKNWNFWNPQWGNNA